MHSACKQHALIHATPMHQHAAYQGLVGQQVERLTAAQCLSSRVGERPDLQPDATAPASDEIVCNAPLE